MKIHIHHGDLHDSWYSKENVAAYRSFSVKVGEPERDVRILYIYYIFFVHK